MQYIKFRKSIYSKQHIALRKFWISKRLELGLSQVELGKNHKVNMVSYEQIINNKN